MSLTSRDIACISLSCCLILGGHLFYSREHLNLLPEAPFPNLRINNFPLFYYEHLISSNLLITNTVILVISRFSAQSLHIFGAEGRSSLNEETEDGEERAHEKARLEVELESSPSVSQSPMAVELACSACWGLADVD